MLGTVLITAFAFGTIAEFQVRIILLRPAADRAFVMGASLGHDLRLPLEIPFALNLFRIHPVKVPRHKEEQDEV